jgi:hypothetical protein
MLTAARKYYGSLPESSATVSPLIHNSLTEDDSPPLNKSTFRFLYISNDGVCGSLAEKGNFT